MGQNLAAARLLTAHNPEYQTFDDSGIPGVIKELVTFVQADDTFQQPTGAAVAWLSDSCNELGPLFPPSEFHPTLARSGKPVRAPRLHARARLSEMLNFTRKGPLAARARREQAAVPSEPCSPKTLQANKKEQARMLVSLKQAQQAPV